MSTDFSNFHFNHIIKLKMAVVESNFFSSQTSLCRDLESFLLKTGRTLRRCCEDLTNLKNFAMRNCRRFFLFPTILHPSPHLPLREKVFLWRSSEPIIICIVLIRSASSGSLECLMVCNAPLFLHFSCSDFFPPPLRFFVSLFNLPCPLLGLGN